MNLSEDLYRIKEVMGILNEQDSLETENQKQDEEVTLVGKVLDLNNMSIDDKEKLKLKEKIVVDNKLNEYPILLIQTRDGKIIMFDTDGSVKSNTEEDSNF